MKQHWKERRKTSQVRVRNLWIGSDYPVAVQSMTNTNTADVDSTVNQILELFTAGSEMVRFTVENEAMAAAVPSIRKKLDDLGCDVPIIGDFHYNGHLLLNKYPQCTQALDKFRINPGNVGFGDQRDDNFKNMVDIAIEYDKPVRIGVNWGSLDPFILNALMEENKKLGTPKDAKEIQLEAVVESAVQSVNKAIEYGLGEDKIIVSTKISEVPEMVKANEMLTERTKVPLHVGLTEAGMGSKGIVASTVALSVLLAKGIGDTIRVSITPKPGSSRTEEVIVSGQVLQSLDLRHFMPLITSCPGCGRTQSARFQEMALEMNSFLLQKMPEWKQKGFKGMEDMKIAVMGCIVNGPGESKNANMGISFPGSGETVSCPIYADGKLLKTIPAENAQKEFKQIVEEYVQSHYGK
ncbi:MAG: flavodoxin-dependent (E)-4-hydroxy-3-methylbut-2-enyl-diphosphate synthase [Candidatus Diapherotrites archaeon]